MIELVFYRDTTNHLYPIWAFIDRKDMVISPNLRTPIIMGYESLYSWGHVHPPLWENNQCLTMAHIFHGYTFESFC